MGKFHQHPDLRFPIGSVILVTGISGMIGIHIADEALKAGFRVRGTVRSQQKVEEVRAILQHQDLELVVVEDMAVEGAFDVVAKGTSAIIHSASITSFSPCIADVVTPTVQGTLNILAAASGSEGVRSVVITSSSGAASGPRPGVKFRIDQDTWNNAAVELVKATPPSQQKEMGFEWPYAVYVASKVEAELAAWAYMTEAIRPFALNIINPAMNWGKVMGSMGISGSHILQILEGNIPPIPSVYMIDTVDDARIHIGAAIDRTMADQRIFACDEPFTWRQVIKIMRSTLPDSTQLPDADPNEIADISEIDNAAGAMLLNKWWDQQGYKGLDRTVRETLEMCLEQRQKV